MSGAGGWHCGPVPRALTPDPRDSPGGSSGPAAALWQARLGTPGSSAKGPYRQEGKGPRRLGGAGSQAHTCPKASARFGTLLPAPLRSNGDRGAVPLPVASFPARIPGSAMGRQAALLGHAGVPHKVPMLRVPPVLRPLLHPCSGTCPVLCCGDFTLLLQVPLPCGLDPAKAQPRRALTEAARIWWYRRVRMHPAPAAWGELQAKAPQTPTGPMGCARHCPYPTLSPQRHFCCWFCTHISVTGTPGTSSSHSGCRDTAYPHRKSCALLHAQCPAGHPRVPPASRSTSWSFHLCTPPIRFALGCMQSKTPHAACRGFPVVTRLGWGQLGAGKLTGTTKHPPNILLRPRGQAESPQSQRKDVPVPALHHQMHQGCSLAGCSKLLRAKPGLFTTSFLWFWLLTDFGKLTAG